MFKIKLLISSLVSFIFISCTNSDNKNYEMKYSLGYITGEYDGLVLKNYLKNYLKSFNLYDENSLFEIRSSISHSSEVYITNIDNTSDRRNVHSNLIIEIVDKVNECNIYEFNKHVSQFQILADSSKYISNNIAYDEIKAENTENLVVNFINNLDRKKDSCSNIDILKNKFKTVRDE